ncbi:MAG TPA: DUF2846 domain-containing protein [Pyrinomonadaceae bacterium]|nr:DUF2846 domain-containing protein [Pyrinomonadaceae bacterium]
MKSLVKLTLLLTLTLAASSLTFAQTATPQPSPQPEVSPSAETPASNAKSPTGDDQPATQDAKGTIYFYRTKKFTGGALEPSVYCDDKELARMDNGRYFGVKLDPGKHTCRMGDKQTGFELDVKAGQDYYARVSLEAGVWKGHGRLTLLQPEQGAFEVKKLKLLGADKVKNRELVTIYEGSDKK